MNANAKDVKDPVKELKESNARIDKVTDAMTMWRRGRLTTADFSARCAGVSDVELEVVALRCRTSIDILKKLIGTVSP